MLNLMVLFNPYIYVSMLYVESVKTGPSQSGPDKGGKCNSIGLSAVCPSKVAMIHSMVVVVM